MVNCQIVNWLIGQLLIVQSCTQLCRFVRKQFQILFHWASRPSFNLSLTVLVHYRSVSLFSLRGWFPWIPSEYMLRGTWDTPRVLFVFAYETFTLYGWQFHTIPLTNKIPRWGPATPPRSARNRQQSDKLTFNKCQLVNWSTVNSSVRSTVV